MTAFLHLLTLKSQPQAKVDSNSEKGLPGLEVSRPANSQSHAETLGSSSLIFSRKRVRSSDRSIAASIFAPILLRDDMDEAFPVSPLGKKKFLLLFMHETVAD